MQFEFYQSGVDNLANRVLRELGAAQHEIIVAMYYLTDVSLVNMLRSLAEVGRSVYVIVDESSPTRLDLLDLAGAFSRVDRKNGLFHCKYSMIDRRVLLAGSYNWTVAGATRNREDLLIVRDFDDFQAQAIYDDFTQLWKGADPVAHHGGKAMPGYSESAPGPLQVVTGASVAGELATASPVLVSAGPALVLVEHARITVRR